MRLGFENLPFRDYRQKNKCTRRVTKETTGNALYRVAEPEDFCPDPDPTFKYVRILFLIQILFPIQILFLIRIQILT
jgi:hypothetical protein